MFWMFLVTNKMSSAVGPAAIHANAVMVVPQVTTF
jgi:hypothetical protein